MRFSRNYVSTQRSLKRISITSRSTNFGITRTMVVLDVLTSFVLRGYQLNFQFSSPFYVDGTVGGALSQES